MMKINIIYGLIFYILYSVITITYADVKTCEKAEGMQNFNISQFNGKWYEISRSDFNQTFEKDTSCVKYEFTPGKVVITLRRNKDKKLQKKESLIGSLTPVQNSNATFSLTLPGNPIVIVKILETDYANYTIACGYVNSNSSGAWVLSKNDVLKDEYKKKVEGYKNNVAGFDKLSDTLQDAKKCNGAGELLPIFTMTIVSVLLAIFKF